MIYLGIDTGLAKGKGTTVCIIRDGKASWERALPGTETSLLRKLERMAGEVYGYCHPDEPATVCVERPMGLSGNALPMMGLYWLICSRVAAHHLTYSVVPSTLKKFITGNGRADKSQIGIAAYRQWRALLNGTESLSEDQGDSLGLAMLAACRRGDECPAGKWTAYQVEAAAKAEEM